MNEGLMTAVVCYTDKASCETIINFYFMFAWFAFVFAAIALVLMAIIYIISWVRK